MPTVKFKPRLVALLEDYGVPVEDVARAVENLAVRLVRESRNRAEVLETDAQLEEMARCLAGDVPTDEEARQAREADLGDHLTAEERWEEETRQAYAALDLRPAPDAVSPFEAALARSQAGAHPAFPTT